MAALPEALQTPVYSPRRLHPVATTGISRTEAFSQLQRQPSVMSAPVPSLAIRLRVQGMAAAPAFFEAAPAWLVGALSSASERWGWEEGWDSYGARPTDPELFNSLLDTLRYILQLDAPSPVMVPRADGGMQAEWHRKRQDLELTIAPEEPSCAYYYYFNEATGEEEEGAVMDNIGRLRALVGRL